MGEPAGVGGEISVKAWRALKDAGPAFFLIDDPARIAALGVPVAEIARAGEAAEHFSSRLPILPIGAAVAAEPGLARPATARFVVRSIECAVRLALSGDAAGVVTNPISKQALLADGFGFPGHTDYLGELTKTAPLPRGVRTRGPVMMLAGPALRTVPVTVHMPLRDAARRLSSDEIFRVGCIVAESLVCDFAVARPRLMIAGFNPHAGEGGALGREEIEIIAPAVARLKAAGVDAAGPSPADTMFHEEGRARYDAAICMYHDQALIPVKTLAFYETVNVTLGLPIVRTSPDHGTALDIAGMGVARPDSLIAAIRLAATMAARRLAAK